MERTKLRINVVYSCIYRSICFRYILPNRGYVWICLLPCNFQDKTDPATSKIKRPFLQLKMIWSETNQHWYSCSVNNRDKKTTNLHWWSPWFLIQSTGFYKNGGKRFLDLRLNSMSPKHIFSQMVGKPWMVVILIPWDPFLSKKNHQTNRSKDFMVVWRCWIPWIPIRKKKLTEKKNTSKFLENIMGVFWKRTLKKSSYPQRGRRGWGFARIPLGRF